MRATATPRKLVELSGQVTGLLGLLGRNTSFWIGTLRLVVDAFMWPIKLKIRGLRNAILHLRSEAYTFAPNSLVLR